MILQTPKQFPEGTGKVATSLRALKKSVKRMFPTGQGVSHGPLGTAFIPRKQRGGGSSTGAASWL